MLARADSIDDLDRLRHGGMGRLFTGIRAPSRLCTFLRSFTFGHVRTCGRYVRLNRPEVEAWLAKRKDDLG